MSTEAEAREYVEGKHPAWHDNGVGIVQGSHYRSGFVDGAVWRDARGQVAPDRRNELAHWLERTYNTGTPDFSAADAILALFNEKGNE